MKTYNLQLTEQELNIILIAISELKLKDSLAVYVSIQNQLKDTKDELAKEQVE